MFRHSFGLVALLLFLQAGQVFGQEILPTPPQCNGRYPDITGVGEAYWPIGPFDDVKERAKAYAKEDAHATFDDWVAMAAAMFELGLPTPTLEIEHEQFGRVARGFPGWRAEYHIWVKANWDGDPGAPPVVEDPVDPAP